MCARNAPVFVCGGCWVHIARGQNVVIVDTGWNFRGSAGVNITPYVGVMLDAGYDSMGISSPTLTNLGFGGGNLSVFSLTLNPIVHLTPKSNVDIYVTGGGGYYRHEPRFYATRHFEGRWI